MKIDIFADAPAVAKQAAAIIAADARAAVAARGSFNFAVSGGHTPWQMLRALATDDVPWHAVRIFQVDGASPPQATPTATSPTSAKASPRSRPSRPI